MPTPGHPYDTKELAELRSSQRRLTRLVDKYAYRAARETVVNVEGDELRLELTLRRLLRDRIEALPVDAAEMVRQDEEASLARIADAFMEFPNGAGYPPLGDLLRSDSTERVDFHRLPEDERRVLVFGLGLADVLATMSGDDYEDPRLT